MMVRQNESYLVHSAFLCAHVTIKCEKTLLTLGRLQGEGYVIKYKCIKDNF